ncbi:MAG TPA: MBL fold metallo-hydrolase [Thermoanaerobaculia bacterium]|jgi:glyoxylase-like metal-dependent hydrolase (beta-lactamase superfamily II)/8-oxo-dGTP pyrophosphatase MutT (NUDIX family)|nr:MBL fold metallo-hydrolase [Thermoanaerobaculia bacterium]
MADDPSGNLYEKVIGKPLAGESPALPPPRVSAAVVLWRRREGAGADDVEVFWVKRAESLPFMGGWHAFPGGGMSRSDAQIPLSGEPQTGAETPPAAGLPEALRDLDEPGPDLLPGLAACALRELFEETGLLLSTPDVDPEDLPEARRALLAGERSFADVLAGFEVRLDASSLVYAGRWVTPPFAPARFDNRFFLLEWPPEAPAQPSIHPGECESGSWVSPAEAWEAWRRGDVLAAPPILHILEVLSQDGPLRGLDRLRDPAESNLGPLRRIEMRPGVVMFPLLTHTLPPAGTTNSYLLGSSEAVLVDPGASSERELDRLEQALAAARERLGRRVTAIWLTHHHPDHVGGVGRLRTSLGVPVLAHRVTAERLAARGIPIDGELHDGERIVLGGDYPVLILHTPGHARGHLCFLEEDQRSLLCGDMVSGVSMIVVDPPEGDMDDYLGSLERLASLRPHTLFPGHGPVIKNAAAKLREYIDHRLWRENRIFDAWSAGLRRPADMLPTVYKDVPRQAWPLAERQILAHLERLQRLGRIDAVV